MRRPAGGLYVPGWAIFAVMVNVRDVSAQTMTRDGDSRSLAPFVFLGLLLLGGGFLAYINYKTNQPFGLERITTLSGDIVIERLVGRYTVEGWTVPSQTDRSVTFYRRGQPSFIVTLLLFILGVIPGLLYLFLGGRDLTIAVTTRLQDKGMTEVEIVGNARSDGSLRIAADVLDELP